MRGPLLIVALLVLLSLSSLTGCGTPQESGSNLRTDSSGNTSGSGNPGAAGDTEGSGNVEGSGNLRTEDRPVQGFSRIEVSTFGTITITQSGSESLRVEADDNILPLLTSEVRNGTLALGLRPNTSISDARIAYTVTVKSLEAVELSGSGQARLIDINTPALEMSVSGSSEITSSGRADEQSVEISGSGSYDGTGLVSKTATVDLSGSGGAVLQVSDTLEVEISGSGDVEYIGNPRVEQDVSGSGTVQRRG